MVSEQWDVAESDFPASALPRDKLVFLARYAVLAPSLRNAQPWLFRVSGETLELYADRARAIPVADPVDREMLIGCGTALFHLRAALRRFGFSGEILRFPSPSEPDLLARVRLGEARASAPEDLALFAAIPARRTNRLPFETRPVPEAVANELRLGASREGSWLHFFSAPAERRAAGGLIEEGEQIQGADPRFRRELLAWLHPNRRRTHDGMDGHYFGLLDSAENREPLPVKTLHAIHARARMDGELARAAPMLALLGTPEDGPPQWLSAGEVLGWILLRAQAAGLSASFFNQPIEILTLRIKLGNLARQGGFPQILFRLGFGPETKPSQRRPLEEVLLR